MLISIGALVIGGCGTQETAGNGGQRTHENETRGTSDHEAQKAPGSTETKSAQSDAPRYVTVTPDGHEGAENVGLLMAQKRGYFSDNDLTVSILLPLTPARPVHYVANGLDDLAIAQEPQVVLERARGAQVAAIGTLISQPTAALIWLKKSQIEGIGDLKGKTIGIPGLLFQKGFLQSVLERGGLKPGDVKVKSLNYNLVSALASGRVDAIFGGSWNLEGAKLEKRGLKPVVKRVQGLGVPGYDEFVVVARSDRLVKEPRLMRDFLSAVIRGNAAAAKDPKAAVNAIMEADLGVSPPNRKEIEAEVAATAPLLSRNGYISPEKANRLTNWMYEEGMIQRKPPVSKLVTNAYR